MVQTIMVIAFGQKSVQDALSSSDNSAIPAISIIHLNDTYRVGDVEEGRRGGFGRVATLVKNLRAEGRTVHITHGGDLLFPSLESQLWGGDGYDFSKARDVSRPGSELKYRVLDAILIAQASAKKNRKTD